MPTIITIAAIPTRAGFFTARCDGRLLCRSRQPFLDGARELARVRLLCRHHHHHAPRRLAGRRLALHNRRRGGADG